MDSFTSSVCKLYSNKLVNVLPWLAAQGNWVPNCDYKSFNLIEFVVAQMAVIMNRMVAN